MAASDVNELNLAPRLAAILEQEYPRFSDAEYARTDRRRAGRGTDPGHQSRFWTLAHSGTRLVAGRL